MKRIIGAGWLSAQRVGNGGDGGCRALCADRRQRRGRVKLLCQAIFVAAIIPVVARTHLWAVPAAVHPNILLIYTDDQGAWTPGVYGNRQSHTPNIDRLAQEGARFTNAFATAPVCSPARASFMTGRYSSEVGINDAISPPKTKTYNDTIGRGIGAKGLSGSFVTFPAVLAKAGYVTGLVGKWHLGEFAGTADKKYHPLNHGFQYFMGMPQGGAKPSGAFLEEDGVVREFPGLIDDVLVDRAIRFMGRNTDRSFFLCLALRSPHRLNLPVPDDIWTMYKDRDVDVPDYPDLDVQRARVHMREYLAAVANLDRNIGQILLAVDKLGLANRTIVLFSSDHGYSIGHNGVFEKGNGVWLTKTVPPATDNIWAGVRPNLHDISLQVPAIVRWPGVVEAGTVIAQAISGVDWYPTLVEMAGAKIPGDVTVRGRSLVPLLRGKKVLWDDEIYAEYNIDNNSHARMRSIRSDGWKLIRDFLNEGRDELYEVRVDPYERRNRISDPEVAAIRTSLDQKILERMRRLHDPVLLSAP